jgi:hypothetical protein
MTPVDAQHVLSTECILPFPRGRAVLLRRWPGGAEPIRHYWHCSIMIMACQPRCHHDSDVYECEHNVAELGRRWPSRTCHMGYPWAVGRLILGCEQTHVRPSSSVVQVADSQKSLPAGSLL